MAFSLLSSSSMWLLCTILKPLYRSQWPLPRRKQLSYKLHHTKRNEDNSVQNKTERGQLSTKQDGTRTAQYKTRRNEDNSVQNKTKRGQLSTKQDGTRTTQLKSLLASNSFHDNNNDNNTNNNSISVTEKESTIKGLIGAWQTFYVGVHIEQQRPQLFTVSVTWHASE